jgi:bud emergence protein 1
MQVIKALYDHTPQDPTDPGYLSFSQGDFLHVVGRENDTAWYEACNPLIGSRGLVPVSFFETVGKTVRDSGSSTRSMPSAGHDSGYAEQTSNTATSSRTSIPSEEPRSGRLSKSLGKGAGSMVYGVVLYDFKAERPDELEAKEGEAIIVIAQSNPEWFVAKPITRLGGPGLIPVAFIEIRDMTTGQAVPDALEAVKRAGVPKVEEWKKMAADYKNGSIPLGKLESNSQQSLQQGIERMSLNAKSQNSAYLSGTTLVRIVIRFRILSSFFFLFFF